jgi:TM2 domain-containing membrane protein YozV
VNYEQQAQAGPQGPGPTIIVQTAGAAPVAGAPKSKIVAGILGILLGWAGAHRFYLGFSGIGAAMVILFFVGLVLMLPTCGTSALMSAGISIWGLVEGILILVGVMNRDAFGRPLTN